MQLGVDSHQFPVNINHSFYDITKRIDGHLLEIVERECGRDDAHDLLTLKNGDGVISSTIPCEPPNRRADIEKKTAPR
jgi:hypothetical protein